MIRFALGSLLALGALSAFGGGIYGMRGAPDVPVSWLEGTPFTSYVVPSAILFVVVGGTLLFASVTTFVRARIAQQAAIAAGVILLGWIGAQVALLGYVSWLQPVTAIAGVVILALAGLSDESRRTAQRPRTSMRSMQRS